MTEVLASFPDPPLSDRHGRVYYRWDWHADKLTRWFEEARAAILRARGRIDNFVGCATYPPVPLQYSKDVLRADRAALVELVRELAEEVITNGMPEHKCDLPEGAPPESYRSCDWCGAYGPQDPYAMTHNDDPEPCWAGQMLARAKPVVAT